MCCNLSFVNASATLRCSHTYRQQWYTGCKRGDNSLPAGKVSKSQCPAIGVSLYATMASYSHSSESPGMVQGAYNTTSTMNGAYSLQSLCFLTSQVSTDHGSIRALFSPPAVALLTTVAAIDIIININHITMAVIISQHYRLCIFPEVFSSPSFCGWVASEEDRRRRFYLFVIAQSTGSKTTKCTVLCIWPSGAACCSQRVGCLTQRHTDTEAVGVRTDNPAVTK